MAVRVDRVGSRRLPRESYCHSTHLRPSVPDPAFMSFDEMCTSLGLVPRKLANVVATCHLVCWHWLQWLLYTLVYGAYYTQIKKRRAQIILGFVVVLREQAYFILTLIALREKPAFLLFSARAAYEHDRTRSDAINFIFGPEKWLARVVFSGTFRWSIASYGVSVFALVIDLCSVVALVVGIMDEEIWFPTLMCYGADTVGALAFIYFNIFRGRDILETPLLSKHDAHVQVIGELRRAGLSVGDLKEEAGFDASQLKAAGFDGSQLKDAGFDATQLQAAGFDASQLKAAGFDARQLKDAGFDARQLNDAGFGSLQMIDAGFRKSQLLDAGYDLRCIYF